MFNASEWKSAAQSNQNNLWVLVGFVLAAAFMRFLPHPPNFLPTTAIAIFAGCQFPSMLVAAGVVLGSMALSDLFLGFHSTMPFVYLALILIILMGTLLKGRENALPVLGVTLASSVLFFFISNFGVWAMQTLYPKNLAGLQACYIAALPFFQNSIISDFFYVILLFGAFAVVKQSNPLAARRGSSAA